jgi:hypothetical protein
MKRLSMAAVAEYAYAALLLLYPKAFRREFGPTMREVFRT